MQTLLEDVFKETKSSLEGGFRFESIEVLMGLILQCASINEKQMPQPFSSKNKISLLSNVLLQGRQKNYEIKTVLSVSLKLVNCEN